MKTVFEKLAVGVVFFRNNAVYKKVGVNSRGGPRVNAVKIKGTNKAFYYFRKGIKVKVV